MPDYRPKGIADLIRPKCKVLYYPVQVHLPPPKVTETTLRGSSSYKENSSDALSGTSVELISGSATVASQSPLHIVWPHRWYVHVQ